MLCHYWLSSGGKTCPYKETCYYAHGAAELVSTPSADSNDRGSRTDADLTHADSSSAGGSATVRSGIPANANALGGSVGDLSSPVTSLALSGRGSKDSSDDSARDADLSALATFSAEVSAAAAPAAAAPGAPLPGFTATEAEVLAAAIVRRSRLSKKPCRQWIDSGGTQCEFGMLCRFRHPPMGAPSAAFRAPTGAPEPSSALPPTFPRSRHPLQPEGPPPPAAAPRGWRGGGGAPGGHRGYYPQEAPRSRAGPGGSWDGGSFAAYHGQHIPYPGYSYPDPHLPHYPPPHYYDAAPTYGGAGPPQYPPYPSYAYQQQQQQQHAAAMHAQRAAYAEQQYAEQQYAEQQYAEQQYAEQQQSMRRAAFPPPQLPRYSSGGYSSGGYDAGAGGSDYYPPPPAYYSGMPPPVEYAPPSLYDSGLSGGGGPDGHSAGPRGYDPAAHWPPFEEHLQPLASAQFEPPQLAVQQRRPQPTGGPAESDRMEPTSAADATSSSIAEMMRAVTLGGGGAFGGDADAPGQRSQTLYF